eukprot:3678275-Amphidinium_carterae.2
MEKLRCRARGCQHRCNDLSNHPIFTSSSNGLDLKSQCYIISQKAIDELHGRVLRHIEQYVENKQKDEPLGLGPGAYPEFECDEVTVAKQHLDGGRVEWTQHWGAMRRGAPHSLKLVKLPSRATPRRVPGPGPINLDMLARLAQEYIMEEDTAYHNDSARAYDTPDDETLHTKVVHQKKYRDGILIKPRYTELVALALPNGKRLQDNAGDQGHAIRRIRRWVLEDRQEQAGRVTSIR